MRRHGPPSQSFLSARKRVCKQPTITLCKKNYKRYVSTVQEDRAGSVSGVGLGVVEVLAF